MTHLIEYSKTVIEKYTSLNSDKKLPTIELFFDKS